jgi:hypothetical protein
VEYSADENGSFLMISVVKVPMVTGKKIVIAAKVFLRFVNEAISSVLIMVFSPCVKWLMVGSVSQCSARGIFSKVYDG